MSNIFAIVMAGGSGTRFWPASRRQRPKQLLAIGPDVGQSLIAATVRRIEPLCPADRILIATGEHLLDATRTALPWLPEESFLGEPAARNTAACIGWATAIIRRRDPNAMVMVLPSDHHVTDEDSYIEALTRAVQASAEGIITTIGIEPTRPETGYGYIEKGACVAEGVHRVARFVEKPDRARAEGYQKSGRYLWNSGMFFFRSGTMMSAIARHMKPLDEGVRRIETAALESPASEVAITREVFDKLPSVSIDYGVMEKEETLNVVPGRFGWSDLGSWQSAWELASRDEDGNAIDPGCLVLDGRNNLVRTVHDQPSGRIVVAIGVDDLCVVDTDDAILVIPRARAQDVRLAVEALKARGETDRL
jgi:mannose-1-phosphate guanylyltransferase